MASALLLRTWNILSQIPWLGTRLFTFVFSFFSPYTGSIPLLFSEITTLGLTKASLTQSRAIENPFGSIHLAALVNAGEACGGVAVVAMLEAGKGEWNCIPKSMKVRPPL
jgi:hypothetical protein